jgi:hypothetical protein
MELKELNSEEYSEAKLLFSILQREEAAESSTDCDAEVKVLKKPL